MTMEQITQELLTFPVSDRAKLAKTLADSVDGFVDGRIESAWNDEISQRITQTEMGGAQIVDSAEVHRQAKQRLDEARQVSRPRK